MILSFSYWLVLYSLVHISPKFPITGPGGDLRVYLENLASAESIPEYVKQNPFGQGAITSSDPSWHFYEEVLNEEQRRKRPRHSRWDC